jgi:hypothetical protein
MFAHYHCNRSGGAWFGIAFFFTPVVAFVLLAILPSAVSEIQLSGMELLARDRRHRMASLIMPAIGFALVLVLVVWCVAAAFAQQQTFRDASGRTVGTATQSGNQTIFRDARGVTNGSATTDSQGTTTFRDARGRTTGTLSNGARR